MDDAVCVSLSLPKKAAQRTALFECDDVHQCVLLYGVYVVSECVYVCSGVVDAGEKREEAKTQSNKKQKGLFPNHFFPFPFFPPLFLPLFSPCLPLFHHHFLLIHTLTYFSCLTHYCIHGEPKTPMTQHLFHFIFFSFCPNSLFLFFFLLQIIQ